MPKSSIAMRTPRRFSAWEALGGGVGVAHDRRLGDLEGQGGWLQAALPEGVADVIYQLVGLELAGGDVDGDAEVVTGTVPRGSLAACLPEPPASRSG